MRTLQSRLCAGAALVFVCSVVCAQNAPAQQKATATAAGAVEAKKGATVQNFPSRQDAQSGWDKVNPPKASETEKGPLASSGGSGPTGRVSGESLPNPKIDYQAEAVERVSPMTPEDIRKFEETMFERAQAMSEPPGGPYTIKGSRIVRLSFEPNSKPEIVDVALNMGALVTFVDRNGIPLVIDGVKAFSYFFQVDVMETEEVKAKGGSSTLEITPKALVGSGTMMVRLTGVSTPLLLQVRVGKNKAVDSLVQAVVPVLNPARTILPGDRQIADAGLKVGEMQGFLMGVPPEGAMDVAVRQVAGVTAWLWRNRMYVRTAHTIFSPGWFQRQAAVDGTAVYELPITSVVRLGMNGREVEAVFDLPFIPNLPSVASAKKK